MSRSGDPRGCPVGRSHCFVCLDHVGTGRRRRERIVARADEAEAQDFAQMSPDERDYQAGTMDFGDGCRACDRGYCGTDPCDCVEPDRGPPLTAPMSHVVRLGRDMPLGSPLARSIFGALLACALVACQPGPAWMPGDPPLEIWAESDVLWGHVATACAAWGTRTGLECRRGSYHETATITVRARPLHDNLNGLSRARPQTGCLAELMAPEIARWITLAPDLVGTPGGDSVMAHELGHHLGVWDHVPMDVAPWALMANVDVRGRDATPSAADWEALAEAWGVDL